MSNRADGTRFETEFCDCLARNGFWAHNMAQKAEGQPADIIAVKNGTAYLIDCKLCEKDSFRLDRIEENQESAMNYWTECGNLGCYFAIKLQSTNEIFMVPFKALRGRWSQKSLKRRDLIMYSGLHEWLRARE